MIFQSASSATSSLFNVITMRSWMHIGCIRKPPIQMNIILTTWLWTNIYRAHSAILHPSSYVHDRSTHQTNFGYSEYILEFSYVRIIDRLIACVSPPNPVIQAYIIYIHNNNNNENERRRRSDGKNSASQVLNRKFRFHSYHF